MSWEQYRRTYEREFPPGVTVEGVHGGGIRVSLPCKHPGCQPEPVEFRMHMPADAAKKVFANKGWRLWGKATTCPEHSKRSEDVKDEPKQRLGVVQASAQASDLAMIVAEPVASAQAREAKRMAMLVLDEKFDAGKGAYKDGCSDLKVAKEVGISEEAVSRIREEFYGPIREPAEITELREKLNALETRSEEFSRQLQATHASGVETLKGLTDEISKVRARLAALVSRNGW